MRRVITARAATIGSVGAVALGTLGAAAPAGAAGRSTRGHQVPVTRPFVLRAVGAMISTVGDKFEKVFRIKTSPDLGGAAIEDGKLNGPSFPLPGNDTMDMFFRSGLQRTADSFNLLPPLANGVGRIVGTGTCTGGSGIHATEKCAYRISGTYDLLTSVTALTLVGTYTR